jgi:hypothetical protein
MTEIDFTRDMTTDEVAAAREAGALAAEQLSGQSLLKGLKVGDMLLFGRRLILRKYGLKAPMGQPYGQYFRSWKAQFGFPVEFDNLDEEKQVKAYFDDAILCASHRGLAEEIIYQLGPKWRANNGVSALARRIRDILRDREKKAAEGGEDDKDDKDMTKTRRKTKDEIEAATREEMLRLRTELVKEKADHAKTAHNRDEILRNPLHYMPGDVVMAVQTMVRENEQGARHHASADDDVPRGRRCGGRQARIRG